MYPYAVIEKHQLVLIELVFRVMAVRVLPISLHVLYEKMSNFMSILILSRIIFNFN